MKKVLELDPSDDQARRTICRLEPLAAEKREKMKEEMIGTQNPNLSPLPLLSFHIITYLLMGACSQLL